jgi:hypothetical protein
LEANVKEDACASWAQTQLSSHLSYLDGGLHPENAQAAVDDGQSVSAIPNRPWYGLR